MSTPTRKWQAGDWAFTSYGNRVWILVTPKEEHQSVYVEFQSVNKPRKYHPIDALRPETFREYITRPTGFGRTKWRSWIAQQVGLACILAAGIATVGFGGWWGIGSWLVIQSVYLYMTWRNFKKLTV